MQSKKQTFLDFSERTNRLAVELSVPLEELPGRIGISRATFFSNRAGKSPISSKTWMKLETLERQVLEQQPEPVEKNIESALLHYPPGDARAIAAELRQEALEHRRQYTRLMQIADFLDPPNL